MSPGNYWADLYRVESRQGGAKPGELRGAASRKEKSKDEGGRR